jgi:DNA polymerase I-like protein with 3'-5' exonuclease and polymerase domains
METRYHIIKNKKELKKLIACCKATGYACCDYETNAEPIYNKSFKPTILSVSWMPGFGASIPLDHFETKAYTSPGWNWKKMLRKFGEEVIENYEITKVAWNWKFDDQVNQKYHIFYRGTCLDGMLAKYVLNEEKPHDLKSMVRRYLPEYGNYEKQDAFDKIPWDKKELDPLCHYGCQDTDYTLRLMLFFEKKLIDLGMYSVFRNLFMCNSRVLTSVEKEGLYLDTEFNKKLLEEYKPKIDAARQAIYDLPRVKKFEKKYNQEKIDKYIQSIEAELEELDYNDPKDKRKIALREQKISNIKAGIFTTKKEQELIRPINLGSPVDLPKLMYSEDGFHFDVIKDNDSGKPSTDEETLTNLRLTVKKPDSPKAIFLDKLLELRGLEKMYKTYIYGWWEKVQDDSRLHGRYNIHGTDSNRFSSADPNMQQIPKTTVDPNIKKQLVAPPGYLYMAFDYSQAELRMMAHLSGDETYLEAFAKGVDPHLGIAAAKYGVPIEEASKIYEDESHPDHKLWKTRRKQAKQIAFGLIYGIGDALLAVKLSDPKAGIIVTKEEARKEMDEFFKKHPKILKFKEKQEKFLRKHGYYTQLFGTKRRLPQIYSNDKQEVAYAIRLGLNFPCQGAAANMTNFGAILVYWLMRQGKLPMMKEACTVHDAVYMYSKPKDINTWTVYTIWNILRNPSTKKYFGFQVDDVTLSMDFTIGRSMAEELPFMPGYDYTRMLKPDFSVEEYMEEYHKFIKTHKIGNFSAVSPEVFMELYKKEIHKYQREYEESRKG